MKTYQLMAVDHALDTGKQVVFSTGRYMGEIRRLLFCSNKKVADSSDIV